MKNILLTSILIFCFTLVEAQNSKSNKNSSESEIQVPQIFTKLKLLKTISVGDYKITFKSVESDGRCPEKVTCVWAGEAVVILEIESPEEITEKRFHIPAAGTSQSILKFENLVLVLKDIQPYPVSADENIKNYYLLVDLQEKQSE